MVRFQRVPRLTRLSLFGPVPVPNSNEARYAMDANGGRWVRKHVEQSGFEALLAEALGWLLGMELRVPLPDAAVEGARDEAAWLSRVVSDVTHWDPAQVARISNLDQLGRALALDVLLMNEDRHAGNILLQALNDLQVRAWAIDHDHALVGWPDDYAAAVQQSRLPSTKNLARGLPVSLLAAGARAAAADATLLPPSLVAEIVQEACDIAGEPRGLLLQEAVASRIAAAKELTEQYIVTLEGAL